MTAYIICERCGEKKDLPTAQDQSFNYWDLICDDCYQGRQD